MDFLVCRLVAAQPMHEIAFGTNHLGLCGEAKLGQGCIVGCLFSGTIPIGHFFDAVGEFKRITGKQHFKAASILIRCKDLPFR